MEMLNRLRLTENFARLKKYVSLKVRKQKRKKVVKTLPVKAIY